MESDVTRFSFIIDGALDGERLDRAVSLLVPEVSRSGAQKLIDDGNVLLNGSVPKKSECVKKGACMEITLPALRQLEVSSQDIELDIRYEDEYLLVVNKPKGMVVHPAAGNYDGTLVNALMGHCGDSLSGINGVIRPGIVHRIDKDTSGLLVVAKTDAAHRGLAAQIKEHSFKREYRAVVRGNVKDDCGTVDAPLGRSRTDRKKQAVNAPVSRRAVTHFEVLERFNAYTYLSVTLETGRTHQIRVHMAYRGNPVAGDTVYGGAKNACGLEGQCLHAAVLGFVHPLTGEYMEFSAELPRYFEDFLNKLKKQYGGN